MVTAWRPQGARRGNGLAYCGGVPYPRDPPSLSTWRGVGVWGPLRAAAINTGVSLGAVALHTRRGVGVRGLCVQPP
jgi:hypothetical protein